MFRAKPKSFITVVGNQATHEVMAPLCGSIALANQFSTDLVFLSPTIKVLSPKYLWEEAGQLFNTLQPHGDQASDMDKVVNHRDWITVALTQLSSLIFTPTDPLFIFFILGWLPVTCPD